MLRKRNQKCQQKQGRGKGCVQKHEGLGKLTMNTRSKGSAFKDYKKTLENGERQS